MAALTHPFQVLIVVNLLASFISFPQHCALSFRITESMPQCLGRMDCRGISSRVLQTDHTHDKPFIMHSAIIHMANFAFNCMLQIYTIER